MGCYTGQNVALLALFHAPSHCCRIGSSLSNTDLDEMIDEADKDGDGQINFEGKKSTPRRSFEI